MVYLSFLDCSRFLHYFTRADLSAYISIASPESVVCIKKVIIRLSKGTLKFLLVVFIRSYSLEMDRMDGAGKHATNAMVSE